MTRCRVFALLTLPTRRSLAWRGSEGSLRCHTVRDLVGEVVPQNEQQHELTIPSCEQNNWRLNLNLMTRENSTQAIRSHGYMRMTSRAQHEKRNGVREGCGKDAPWESPTAGFPTELGNPAKNAGFPLFTQPRRLLGFSLLVDSLAPTQIGENGSVSHWRRQNRRVTRDPDSRPQELTANSSVFSRLSSADDRTFHFVCFNPETGAVPSWTSISENPEMFEFSGMSYLPKRHAFSGLRFGRRLAFLLSGKPKNMAL
jgi:hypothetical protein